MSSEIMILKLVVMLALFLTGYVPTFLLCGKKKAVAALSGLVSLLALRMLLPLLARVGG